VLDGNDLHVRNISKNGELDDHRQRDGDVSGYFISQCRARGIRVTTQRLAVFQELARTRDHPTADFLYERLSEKMPALSLSTVYRVLESLEGAGLIRRVNSTNSIARYDGNHRPHQHLVCRVCGRIIDIEVNALSGVEMPRTDLSGFVAEEIDIRIVGICTECLSVPKSTRSLKNKSSGRRPSSH